jgi:hypothetical protein
VVFLRRFSGFADRSLVVDLIKSMPANVPLAFVASRADQARNWDPFVWAFGGLRIMRVLKNLPIQVKTSDKQWTETVERILQNATCVIVDLSERSQSIELEMQMIDQNVSRERVIVLLDRRKMVDDSSDLLFTSAIRYSPSFVKSAMRCLVKVGLILMVWWFNMESIWGWVPLLILPFLIMPSVSRGERSEIREALRTAMRQDS